jgi:hypothetical protein
MTKKLGADKQTTSANMPQTKEGAAKNPWLRFCRERGKLWRMGGKDIDNATVELRARLDRDFRENGAITLDDVERHVRDVLQQQQ